MAQFESSIKVIPYSQEQVYAKLSDMSNLESMKDQLPQHGVRDLSFDKDSLSFSASPLGKISLSIVERDPYKCIKFGSTNSPLPFTLWIQLVPVSEDECKMKLTTDVEVNAFVKGMIQKPLKEGLEQMADTLASIPY